MQLYDLMSSLLLPCERIGELSNLPEITMDSKWGSWDRKLYRLTPNPEFLKEKIFVLSQRTLHPIHMLARYRHSKNAVNNSLSPFDQSILSQGQHYS